LLLIAQSSLASMPGVAACTLRGESCARTNRGWLLEDQAFLSERQ
jgi:hypothetical protein